MSQSQRVVDENDNTPKWTTIEKATKGFETAEHKIARIKKELDEIAHEDESVLDQNSAAANQPASNKETIVENAEQPSLDKAEASSAASTRVQSAPKPQSEEPKTSDSEQSESVLVSESTKKVDLASEVESNQQSALAESQDDEFSLLAEEAEAKAWDQVLTQEKEQALLNSLSADDNADADAENENENENENSNTAANVTHLDESNSEVTETTGRRVDAPVSQPPSQKILANQNTSSNQSDESTSVQDATKELIEEFLPHKEKDERLAGVEKLLARISLATQPKVQAKTDNKVQQSESVAAENEISQQAAEATFVHRDADKLKDILPDVFQTLIFKVGKMPLAVPLLKLGGIVKVSNEDITPLVGTPDWFIGLVPNDRGNLMVVDTQSYLMPEQPRMSVEEMNYEYLILLDDSNWALACNSVGDAKNLVQDDIRWSERSSRRPWFAGMVVEYMSALIEVDELINMLADTITKK